MRCEQRLSPEAQLRLDCLHITVVLLTSEWSIARELDGGIYFPGPAEFVDHANVLSGYVLTGDVPECRRATPDEAKSSLSEAEVERRTMEIHPTSGEDGRCSASVQAHVGPKEMQEEFWRGRASVLNKTASMALSAALAGAYQNVVYYRENVRSAEDVAGESNRILEQWRKDLAMFEAELADLERATGTKVVEARSSPSQA